MTHADMAQANELLRRSTVAAMAQIQILRALEMAAGDLSRAGFVVIGFDAWREHAPTLYVEPPSDAVLGGRMVTIVTRPHGSETEMFIRHGKVRVHWTIAREAA